MWISLTYLLIIQRPNQFFHFFFDREIWALYPIVFVHHLFYLDHRSFWAHLQTLFDWRPYSSKVVRFVLSLVDLSHLLNFSSDRNHLFHHQNYHLKRNHHLQLFSEKIEPYYLFLSTLISVVMVCFSTPHLIQCCHRDLMHNSPTLLC